MDAMDTASAEPEPTPALSAAPMQTSSSPPAAAVLSLSASTGRILTTILEPGELEQLAPVIVSKIETYFDGRFSDFLTAKALHDNAQRKVGECVRVRENEGVRRRCANAHLLAFVSICNCNPIFES